MEKVIYPGSFDPPTRGHQDILKRVSDKFDKVIVGVGQNPDKKYMFSFPERVKMISGVTKEGLNEILNAEVKPFSGLLVDFSFEQGVNTVVRGIRGAGDLEDESLMHWVGESQKLGIDTLFLLSKQDQTHVSSSVTKSVLKEQGMIHDYVTLNVKHFLESRMKGQYIIGVTGTIGTGKSYVTDKLVHLGQKNDIPVHNIDLDEISHRILEESIEEGYKNIRQQLVNSFGEVIRTENGFIDKKKLGEIVFNDVEKKKQLDSIMYEPILLKIRKDMKDKEGIIILNGALLAESGINDLANNNIILVGSDLDTQKERLTYRGLDSQQIENRTNSQFCTEEKRDIIKDNIDYSGYGEIVDFHNNGYNEEHISRLFDDMVCLTDIFGELRLNSVLSTLGLEDKWLYVYNKVKSLYDQPDRLYHNWFHVVDCLDQLYDIKTDLKDEDFFSLFFAIVFHDSIYKPQGKSGESEYQSAELADTVLDEIGFEKDILEEVKRLIKLTFNQNPNTSDKVGKYMLDIDLSILGRDWDTYIQYTKSIRQEFYCYSEKEFIEGRLSFLKKMLNKKIFYTEYFSHKYEPQAKQNIQREILMLENSQN